MTATVDVSETTWAIIPVTRTDPTGVFSRRSLRNALGFLWLLDGALQLQSFMFTRGFAHQIIAPAGVGQPSFVSVPVRWNAEVIAHQPVLCTICFAAVQLAIGIGFLIPRTWRPAIVASMLWAGGVWYTGEGLGGLASGHVNALVGAPGAALLYVVLAVAAWPETHAITDDRRERPPHWLLPVWVVLWVGAAVLDLLPGNRPASMFSAQLGANASEVPTWLGRFDHELGHVAHGLGVWTTLVVVAVELTIGLAAIGPRPVRSGAIVAGMVVAAVYWAVGQSFGQLFSGQATDPSTGPLLILIGLAALTVPLRLPRQRPSLSAMRYGTGMTERKEVA